MILRKNYECICQNGSIVILIHSSLLEIHSEVFMDGKIGLLVFVPEKERLEGGQMKHKRQNVA